jgi:hypothetical protein
MVGISPGDKLHLYMVNNLPDQNPSDKGYAFLLEIAVTGEGIPKYQHGCFSDPKECATTLVGNERLGFEPQIQNGVSADEYKRLVISWKFESLAPWGDKDVKKLKRMLK